jgi:hypothetical protein
MKKLFLFAIIIVSFQILSAQHVNYSVNDTIYPIKVNLGYKYYQSGNLLRMFNLTEVLATEPESHKKYNNSKLFNVGAYLFSFAGGFLVGYELGGILAGRGINWARMGSGLGAIAASIPLSVLAEKRKKEAVKIFNQSLKN